MTAPFIAEKLPPRGSENTSTETCSSTNLLWKDCPDLAPGKNIPSAQDLTYYRKKAWMFSLQYFYTYHHWERKETKDSKTFEVWGCYVMIFQGSSKVSEKAHLHRQSVTQWSSWLLNMLWHLQLCRGKNQSMSASVDCNKIWYKTLP